ncbi:MAG: hypothetical protein HC887_05410, partial [Desulfobacteraceae bacterium]|nr:hypothetical protein [Desulfobacteraceae bacterium]
KLMVANTITAIEYLKAMENGHLAKFRAELAKKMTGKKIPVTRYHRNRRRGQIFADR